MFITEYSNAHNGFIRTRFLFLINNIYNIGRENDNLYILLFIIKKTSP